MNKMEQAVTERIYKAILIAAAALCPLVLVYFAYSRPGYFGSQTYMGGLILLEFLAVAVLMYRQVFFPIVMLAFLFAGVDLPVGAYWTAARWLFLAVAAAAGAVLMLKEHSHHFGLFHIIASFAVLATLISAAVSQYPGVAILKALSFGLLFLYAGTGVRLAVTGNENRFFTSLLGGCEVFVAGVAVLSVAGIEAMGNPNSLGAVMGVAAAPLLFWGTLLNETVWVHRRRLLLYGVCMYLVFHSHSRDGLGAALISSGLLCIFATGTGIILTLIAAVAILHPETLSNTASVTSTILYKGSSDGSLLASRQSPWKAATDSISSHYWFGTGLGTTENLDRPTGSTGMFSSSSVVTTENGSSYLAILAGVGIVGALPFSFLLLFLLSRVFRTMWWMLKTGNACHPAVPLAMVLLAGLIHAGFEDWLFAPGYYLCVLFWTFAFVLVDVAPSPARGSAFAWRFEAEQRTGGIASSR
ncbi:MAG: hypothetical protein DMG79_17750 [Acidobacteria bacterium]|nr:MAG: hypothetical protein DMG79_17750 [Acidobacteriota bacterium]